MPILTTSSVVRPLALGAAHTCAIGNTGGGVGLKGDVYCWGANDRGQLGVGDTSPRSGPVRVLALDNIALIVAGAVATVAKARLA